MKKLKILLIACATATLATGAVAFSACDESVKAHEHVWESEYVTVERATCSKEGSKVRHCTFPGCTATDSAPIPKLEHTWKPESGNSATCTAGGYVIWTCSECNATEQGAATPPLGHNLIAGDVIKASTCVEAGQTQYKCSRCDYTEVKDVAKLDHDYQYDEEKSEEPTCEKPGKTVYTCVNGCNQSEEQEIEKLDHELENEVYEEPTFEADGHRTGTCKLCHQNIDETIPKLVDGDFVKFVFKIMKGKQVFTNSSMKIVVKNEKGAEVASGNSKNVIGGRFTVKLKIYPGAKFTLTLENLSGYTAEPVTLTPANPNGQVNVFTRIYDEGDTNAPRRFGQNSIVQDFKKNDYTGKEVCLRDVLKENKVVALNFFYTTCPGCTMEAAGLEAAYTKYKDKGLAVIGITCDYYDKVNTIETFATKYNCTFPLILDTQVNRGEYLYQKYNVIAFPTTVFINHEGIVELIPQAGGYAQEAFEYWFKMYTDTTWDDLDTESEAETAVPVIPEDDSNGLLISVLRGDYLPGEENE